MSAVDHPPHYGGADDPYEVIKVLRAWLTPQEYAGFFKGNVIKYEARARSKGGLQDYEKALWYQRELIEFLRDVGYDAVYPMPARPAYWMADGDVYDDLAELSACIHKTLEPIMVSSNVAPHVRFAVRYRVVDNQGEGWELCWFTDISSARKFVETAAGFAVEKASSRKKTTLKEEAHD